MIRKHIESTILHEISHVLPTSDEFAKEEDEEDSSGGQSSKNSGSKESDELNADHDEDKKYAKKNGAIIEEDDEIEYEMENEDEDEDEEADRDDYYVENPTQITTAVATVSPYYFVCNNNLLLFIYSVNKIR